MLGIVGDVLNAGAKYAETFRLAGEETKKAALSFMVELANKRIDAYSELWDLVGDLCPPKLIGGAINPSEALKRDDIDRIAQSIDRWYKRNGVLMDPNSRHWLISLREECFSWLSIHRNADSLLVWQGAKSDNDPLDDALRIWLVKTSLRISLNQVIASPVLRSGEKSDKPNSDGKPQPGWISSDKRVIEQLYKTYRAIRTTWQRSIDGHNHLVQAQEKPGMEEINSLPQLEENGESWQRYLKALIFVSKDVENGL